MYDIIVLYVQVMLLMEPYLVKYPYFSILSGFWHTMTVVVEEHTFLLIIKKQYIKRDFLSLRIKILILYKWVETPFCSYKKAYI